MLLWNKALIKKMLVFGYSFDSRIFVDAVKRASALGSIQQEDSHDLSAASRQMTTAVGR
jgi:hypothetical protein